MITDLPPAIISRTPIASWSGERMSYDRQESNDQNATIYEPLDKYSSSSYPKELIATGSRDDVNQGRKFEKYQPTAEAHTSDVILNAFMGRVTKILAVSKSNLEGDFMSVRDAGELIRMSERYLRALNSNDEYRTFISTLSLTIKCSVGVLDARKIDLLSDAISSFAISTKKADDNKRFVKMIMSSGLSVFRV